MLRKNEVKVDMTYVGNVEPHYGLRKLSIGVASVLLGMSIYGVVGHADSEVGSLKPVDNSKNVNVNENAQSVNVSGSDQVVLQSKNAGNAFPSTVNSEGGGTENKESDNDFSAVGSDQQFQQNNLVDANDNRNTDFAGLQQSLVHQSNNETAVRNVHASFSNIGDSSPHYPNAEWDQDMNLSFDVDLSGYKNGDEVKIGSFDQSSDTGRNIGLWRFYDPRVLYKGKDIGYLYIQGRDDLSVPLYFHLSDKPQVTGSLSLTVSAPKWLRVNYICGNNFRGVPSTHVKLQFKGMDGSTFNVGSYTVNQPHLLYYDQYKGHEPISNDYFTNTYEMFNGAGSLVFDVSHPEFDSQQLASYLSGNVLDKPLNVLNKNYMIGYDFNSSNDLLPNNIGSNVYFRMPVVDHGRYVVQLGAGYAYASSGATNAIPCRRVQDGLTISELKSLMNPSKSEVLYSVQDPRHLILISNLAADAFYINQTPDQLYNGLSGTTAVSATTDPAASTSESVDAIGKVFSNYALYGSFWIRFHFADPTLRSTVRVTSYDLSSNKLVSSTIGTSSISTSTVKGQSTVKLHVITPSGVALQQVKSFTDWPNQNKHASLMIPSITGYHLVSNPPQILSQLHLSGTAISSSISVNYPVESTIADYYVVMAPDTESVKVNIVDSDEGTTLNSYTFLGDYGSVITSTSDLSTRLESLLSSGKYDLVTNPLTDSPKYSTTNSPITISLKHHLDSTQRHYRVIEDLPDGTKKVIIDIEATLYKDANEKYYGEWGANLNGTGKVLKSNEYRILSGQPMSSLSNNSNVVSAVDMIPGYTVAFVDSISMYQDGVHAVLMDDGRARVDVFNGSGAYNDPASGSCAIDPLSSRDFHIIYTKKQYPVTINYYDTAGKQISTLTTTHTYLDQVDANATAPAGYVLLSGQSTKLTVGWDYNELDLLVAPAITNSQESRTITRIITNDQGQVLAVQHVNFHRETITNNIDHSVTHTAWVADGPSEFAAYVPVLQAGYVADPVEAQTVTGDSENSMVKVHYQSVNLRPVPKYVDVNGVGYDTLPVGYEVVSGQDTSKDGLLIIKKPQNIQPTPIQYVTRTVTVIMPNGQKRYIRQKARKGTKFLKVHLPRLRGYAMTITGGSVDAMAANSDQDVTVVFAK